MKQKNPDFEEKDFTACVDDDEFDIGQDYEKVPASKIVCTKCGTDKFIVGKGWHFTAIKCPNCLYQCCIHSG